MIIAFCTERLGTWQNPPIWGDERLIIGVKKYLEQLPGVTRVDLYDKNTALAGDVDVSVHIQPGRSHKQRARKTVLWYQSDHPYSMIDLQEQYDGLLLASNHHAGLAAVELPDGYPWQREPVVYTDPDDFSVRPRTANYPVVYLGNNIKGKDTMNRYIMPALPHGLQLFGWGWDHTPLAGVSHGPLKGFMSTTQLYMNSAIVLACHLPKHREWDMPVVRATEAMMCRALVISDDVGRDIWGDRILYTEGRSHLDELLTYWLAHQDERHEYIAGNRAYALQHLSFEKQARRMVPFFERVMNA